jgi:hypothetical protein
MMDTLAGIEIKGFNETAHFEADLCQLLSIMPANLQSLHWAILDLERASELDRAEPHLVDQDIPDALASSSSRWEALVKVTQTLTNIANITIAGWRVESNTPELGLNIQMALNLEVMIAGINKTSLRIISRHVNLLQLVQTNYQHTEIAHLPHQDIVKLIQNKLQNKPPMTSPDKLAKAQESLKQKPQSLAQPEQPLEQAPEHVGVAPHLKTEALSPEVAKTTANKLAKAQEAAKQNQQAQTPKLPSHQAEKREDSKLAKAQESVKQHQQTPTPAKVVSDQTKPITQPVKEAPHHSPDSQRR